MTPDAPPLRMKELRRRAAELGTDVWHVLAIDAKSERAHNQDQALQTLRDSRTSGTRVCRVSRVIARPDPVSATIPQPRP